MPNFLYQYTFARASGDYTATISIEASNRGQANALLSEFVDDPDIRRKYGEGYDGRGSPVTGVNTTFLGQS